MNRCPARPWHSSSSPAEGDRALCLTGAALIAVGIMALAVG
jgi:hypothetical protein